jgi:hypothetical protein
LAFAIAAFAYLCDHSRGVFATEIPDMTPAFKSARNLFGMLYSKDKVVQSIDMIFAQIDDLQTLKFVSGTATPAIHGAVRELLIIYDDVDI